MHKPMYDQNHCKEIQDYVGCVLVLNPEALGESYKEPDYQLFYADHEIGPYPGSMEQKFVGQFLKDGGYGRCYQGDFIGELKNEFLPEWAAEKLAQFQTTDEQEQYSQTM